MGFIPREQDRDTSATKRSMHALKPRYNILHICRGTIGEGNLAGLDVLDIGHKQLVVPLNFLGSFVSFGTTEIVKRTKERKKLKYGKQVHIFEPPVIRIRIHSPTDFQPSQAQPNYNNFRESCLDKISTLHQVISYGTKKVMLFPSLSLCCSIK
ncbi:hypothetical protein V6N13_098199 [Hibiscus sabdariffa]